ncbi:MAG: hypothetical protein AAF653_04465 [Chloroflexota bacterium]
MPRQNRVTPHSTLITTPARGTLMGNRGCLHNDDGDIVRPYAVRRWIICLLNFKDRHREIMQPGRYTELFFLDEAVALAAGHRPCAECQRARYNTFRETWAAANPSLTGLPPVRADDMDNVLHRERLLPRHSRQDFQRRTFPAPSATLPDGVFVQMQHNPTPHLLWQGQLYPYSPAGYGAPHAASLPPTVTVITPPSVVATIAHGFTPHVHPSLDASRIQV